MGLETTWTATADRSKGIQKGFKRDVHLNCRAVCSQHLNVHCDKASKGYHEGKVDDD